MKLISFALLCVLLAGHLTGLGSSPKASGQTEIPTDKLLGAMRTMNTFEVGYRAETGRFAGREELLAFLQQKGVLSKVAIDLEDPKPYTLAITTSPDGKHYQIALKRLSDRNDESSSCQAAVFTDDTGVIFLGSALGCEASTH